MPSTCNPDTGLILSTVRITGKIVSDSPLLRLEVKDGTNHLPLNCKRKKKKRIFPASNGSKLQPTKQKSRDVKTKFPVSASYSY